MCSYTKVQTYKLKLFDSLPSTFEVFVVHK